MKIQVATSSGCPVTKLSVLLGGWVGGVRDQVRCPPTIFAVPRRHRGRPAGLLLKCVAGLLALQGGQPAVFIGAIFAASSARANLWGDRSPASRQPNGWWVGGWMSDLAHPGDLSGGGNHRQSALCCSDSRRWRGGLHHGRVRGVMLSFTLYHATPSSPSEQSSSQVGAGSGSGLVGC